MDLVDRFKGLLSTIEPDPEYVAATKAAHETIRDELKVDDDVGEAYLDTFLSGSYRRSTAIREIKDVDVIFIIDIDHLSTEPDLVIVWLQGALQKLYTNVRRQPRSVRVISDSGVKIDIVPGTPQRRLNTDGPLWIPDREAGSWVPTHPKGQVAFAQERNKSTDGYYVQIVKILKHWRDRLTPASSRAKSYIVECLVAESLGSSAPASHGEGIVKVLEGSIGKYMHFVSTGSVPQIPDPGYPSISVSKRWSHEEFDSFMNSASAGARIAGEAYESQDVDESNRLWKELFGAAFAPSD